MSIWELLLTILVALLVLGPERLPTVARQLGRVLGKCRSLMSNLQSEFEQQCKLDELKKNIKRAEQVEQND